MAKKILVADDEPFIVELIQTRLEADGYEVIVSGDGQKIIEMTRREKPDLIILDIMMPKMDGYKVSRLLKFDNQFKHIPILMCTARDLDEDRELGYETGANEYLTKPFDIDTLARKVKELLGEAI